MRVNIHEIGPHENEVAASLRDAECVPLIGSTIEWFDVNNKKRVFEVVRVVYKMKVHELEPHVYVKGRTFNDSFR